MTNTELLKKARVDAGLTYNDIARLCRVSPETVRSWMKPNAKSGRQPPDGYVELLYLKLGLESPFEDSSEDDGKNT